MFGGKSSPVSGSTIRSSEPAKARPFVVRRRSSGSVVRPIETKPPHSVLPNEETCVTYGQPLLHQSQRAGRADGDHEPQRAQVGRVEERLVLHREPDRLERREGERAPLAPELLESRAGIEAATHVDESARCREGCEERDEAADVEERQRRPEAIGGRQLERAAVVERLRRHALVVVDAALRIRGRSRRVEDDRSVVRPHGRLEALELAVGDRLARGDETGLVEANHDAALVGQLGVVEQRRELRVEQEEVHAGVGDDVRELPCLVSRVHRHGHGADPHRAEEHRERLDAVGVEEADAVAVLDAGSAKPPRHHPRQCRELRERRPLVGQHHRLSRRERRGAVDESCNRRDPRCLALCGRRHQ